MAILDYFKIFRPEQWYKNLLIFLPLIFSISLFDTNLFLKTCLGFLSLCLISSANYIINDLIDKKSDRIHPEKRKRPIAKGTVNSVGVVIIALLSAFFSLLIANALSVFFMYCVIALFILTQAYSFALKKEAFADVLIISINFVIRAVSGVFIMSANNSPWLILCPFFLALFLSLGKREADIRFLGKDADSHKPVLRFYTIELTQSLMIIATSLLIISYSLYAVSANQSKLLLTLPFALYVIMRYFYLVRSGSATGRKPHLALKDLRMVIGIMLWSATAFVALYILGFGLF